MGIESKINSYLSESKINEAKKINLDKIATQIVDNMDINNIMYEYVQEFFDGTSPLGFDDSQKLFKKIATKLKKELK